MTAGCDGGEARWRIGEMGKGARCGERAWESSDGKCDRELSNANDARIDGRGCAVQ